MSECEELAWWLGSGKGVSLVIGVGERLERGHDDDDMIPQSFLHNLVP